MSKNGASLCNVYEKRIPKYRLLLGFTATILILVPMLYFLEVLDLSEDCLILTGLFCADGGMT